jgi:hypothetical protein
MTAKSNSQKLTAKSNSQKLTAKYKSQKQTYVKTSTDIDVDRIILLFKVLVGMIFVLLAVVGGIVVKEIREANVTVCISLVMGDGVCDDGQNIAECDYDGEDCCLDNIIMQFCEDCRCHLGKCSE